MVNLSIGLHQYLMKKKEIPKNIVDLIEQNGIQFTKAGKPVDNPDKYSISIDVDTNKITVITK